VAKCAHRNLAEDVIRRLCDADATSRGDPWSNRLREEMRRDDLRRLAQMAMQAEVDRKWKDRHAGT